MARQAAALIHYRKGKQMYNFDAHGTDAQYTEPKACKITINGTKYVYPLKPDVYDGEFAISTDGRTQHGARLNTFVSKGSISYMTYLTDQGYVIPG